MLSLPKQSVRLQYDMIFSAKICKDRQSSYECKTLEDQTEDQTDDQKDDQINLKI